MTEKLIETNITKFSNSEQPELYLILEGVLMASDKPLTIDQLALLFSEHERPSINEISDALTNIANACKHRGFELKQVASGFRFQVKQSLATWVGRLWEDKPQRYTRALLETLVLIAYRQPITRGEIEDVRGVAVNSNIIRTLQEREWIRVVGHREVPGRPAMFATTRQFLDYFNLENLNELPTLSDIRNLEEAAKSLENQTDLHENIKSNELLSSDKTATKEIISSETLFAELDKMEAELPDNFDDLFKDNNTEELIQNQSNINSQTPNATKTLKNPELIPSTERSINFEDDSAIDTEDDSAIDTEDDSAIDTEDDSAIDTEDDSTIDAEDDSAITATTETKSNDSAA